MLLLRGAGMRPPPETLAPGVASCWMTLGASLATCLYPCGAVYWWRRVLGER